MSTPLAKTYLYVGTKCYFVITIDREQSDALGQWTTYAETAVCDFDTETGQYGSMVTKDYALAGSLSGHMRVMERLMAEGAIHSSERG